MQYTWLSCEDVPLIPMKIKQYPNDKWLLDL